MSIDHKKDPITGAEISEQGYVKKVDVVDASNTYVGVAKTNDDGSGEVWQIYKIVESGTVTTTSYANGEPEYVHEWDERASYTYA